MLMIVYNFNKVRISVLPGKEDTPLAVDPNAILPLSVAFEGFQPVPGGIFKLSKDTAAFRISSLIRACLDIARNFLTSKSSNSFSVSLHLNDLIMGYTYDVMRIWPRGVC